MTNRYKGTCCDCGKLVGTEKGILEKSGGRWIVRCVECYNKSDNSSAEDRCCGDRAYEDQCAAACGF